MADFRIEEKTAVFKEGTRDLRQVEVQIEGILYRLVELSGNDGKKQGRRKGIVRPDFFVRFGAAGLEVVFDLRKLIGVAGMAMPIKSLIGSGKSQPVAGSESRALVSLPRQSSLAPAAAGPGYLADWFEDSTPYFFKRAVFRSWNPYKFIAGGLLLLLIAVSGYAVWKIENLKNQEGNIDYQIARIEGRLNAGVVETAEVESLLEQLKGYESRATELQKNIFYKLGLRNSRHDFIANEIKALMSEFGAERYRVPPEFVDQVNLYVDRYEGSDRQLMARALGRSREELDQMRLLLRKNRLPEDLAYMTLVESGLEEDSISAVGAAGLWQFMEGTARDYGMEVSDNVDDRFNLGKSTQAASRYIRDLILEFGAGSSVMLAMAAYNVGPEKVRRAIRSVRDPINQRNFWYLYKSNALPEETRTYVPKVVAAMIIGRNPARFGF